MLILWLCIIHRGRNQKILCNLLHERRLLFILILFIFLLLVDDYSMRSVIFFGGLDSNFIDFVATYIPRKMAFLTVTMILGVIIWNIINATFIGASCMKSKPWTGVYGKISDCTIRRLINQTILSLLVSAAVVILTGATDILFFCNSNIYRATGTGIRMYGCIICYKNAERKASSMRDALGWALGTGTGKTVISLYFLSEIIKRKTIILVIIIIILEIIIK